MSENVNQAFFWSVQSSKSRYQTLKERFHRSFLHEEAVGAAVKEAIGTELVTREELFITTKLWCSDASHDGAKKAFERSMKKLGLDYPDLYLIHQPYGNVYGVWRAMTELYNEKKIRAVGVSNFYVGKFTEFNVFDEYSGRVSVKAGSSMYNLPVLL